MFDAWEDEELLQQTSWQTSTDFCPSCTAGQHDGCARNQPDGTDDMCPCVGSCDETFTAERS